MVLLLGIASLVGGLLRLSYSDSIVSSKSSVMAQKPRRWIAGDTLWLEVDSIPSLPSEEELMRESLLMLYPGVEFPKMYPDSLRYSSYLSISQSITISHIGASIVAR